jgi:hypothetical protein
VLQRWAAAKVSEQLGAVLRDQRSSPFGVQALRIAPLRRNILNQLRYLAEKRRDSGRRGRARRAAVPLRIRGRD